MLVEHLKSGTGVLLLIAEEGVGKTEALRSAVAVTAETGRRTIMVGRPSDGRVGLTQLVSTLQSSLVGDPTAADQAINSFNQPPRKGLIIDDIELMPDECVRVVLSIAQFKRGDPDGPAIILSSSLDLTRNKSAPDLAQLIALARNTVRMTPLGPAEVRQYIERSLWIAGGTTRRLITADAIKDLIVRSGGLPGRVNRLMEAAFIAGFARGDTMITAKTLTAAVGPISRRRSARTQGQSPGLAGQVLPFIASALLVLGASVFSTRR